MKVLTAAEMREVDRQTVELGIPERQLMENAGNRVLEFLVERFSPLSEHRIVVFCGKGNNGGDGLVVARELRNRFSPVALHVVTTDPPIQVTDEMRTATLVIDAILGTGLQEAARGRALDLIREINTGFPGAKVVAVDLPSGMASDSGRSSGEFARADATVTFTAPKPCHVFQPNCDRVGELRVAHIGSPPELYSGVKLNLTEPADVNRLLTPRPADSNKGRYGHVLVVGGAPGKFGAAEMAGLAALRTGAGLVTVASAADRLHTLELMTTALPQSYDALQRTAARMTVLAIGPGLGDDSALIEMVQRAVQECQQPMVLDADGLNAIAGLTWHAQGRILTPHPGEMARLCGKSIADVQADRLEIARSFAAEHGSTVVLKGHRTIIAFPDGRAWVNPTGSPALAKGGTGDILTGMIAGMMAQSPEDADTAVVAAVYLHGLAGELGAVQFTDRCLLATDLLSFLPEAIRACTSVRN